MRKVQWSCQAVPNLQAINKKTDKIVFALEINKQTDEKTRSELFDRRAKPLTNISRSAKSVGNRQTIDPHSENIDIMKKSNLPDLNTSKVINHRLNCLFIAADCGGRAWH